MNASMIGEEGWQVSDEDDDGESDDDDEGSGDGEGEGAVASYANVRTTAVTTSCVVPLRSCNMEQACSGDVGFSNIFPSFPTTTVSAAIMIDVSSFTRCQTSADLALAVASAYDAALSCSE